MISATDPVGPTGSSSDAELSGVSLETNSIVGLQYGNPTEFPNNIEVLSDAAIRASAQHQTQDASQSSVVGDNETCETSSLAAMTPRAYQLEMLDKSLKQNAIVVMDTGSGKTQVAVLRIKAELDRSDPDKIIWFLAPTVALCSQQFEVIRLQTASVKIKLLTGNDNVDTWSGDVWSAILDDVRIVVSTHQVLLDALCHGFFDMDCLSLIVFDEAHNCTGKHPGSKIMTDFYHRSKRSGRSVPSILGITATPCITEDVQNIEVLEAVLDARCATPTLHRNELFKRVKRPQIRSVLYNPPGFCQPTESMRRLQSEIQNLDITKDPYIIQLGDDPTERNRRALAKAVEKYDTFTQNQIRALWGRCVEISLQLGSWAADLYIWKAASTFLSRIENADALYEGWVDAEKQYMVEFLRRVSPQRPPPMPQDGNQVSEKASALVRELISVQDPIVCIIFAQERATVGLLCDLLRTCPGIVGKHRIGAVVGASNHRSRKNALYEPLGDTDQSALQSFQSGKINILIATSVLEEGIDVPACNMVICFDQPSTPKSFIQRRGRARMTDSKLLLFTEYESAIISRWEALEEDMKAVYQSTQRDIRQLQSIEESDEKSQTSFTVKSTGARLDFENAKNHLDHFCKTVSIGEFVDNRPDYVIRTHWDSSPPTLSATVLLPSFIPTELRQAESRSNWLSESNATKDAAFQAYLSLYTAGLVSEHLLPFKCEDLSGVESRAPVVEVEPLFNPWVGIAVAWKQEHRLWRYSLTLHDETIGESEFDIILPIELNNWRPIQLYPDMHETCVLQCISQLPISALDSQTLPDHTSALLALHFSYRWTVEEARHVVKISAKDIDMSIEDIGAKLFDASDSDMTAGKYLIRTEVNVPFQYVGLLPSRPSATQVQNAVFDHESAPEDVPYLVVKKWTKRADFLHPVCEARLHTTTKKLYPHVIPLPWATVDEIPLKYAKLGMFIPSVLHELEVMMVVKELSTTVMRKVGISDLGLVRQAISCRSSDEPVNYERLEFLGDSVLKYCATIQVCATSKFGPISDTGKPDRLVSNSRLARAAIGTGLPRFILTKSFTGQKWRPLYLAKYEADAYKVERGRAMSTKTLADVVEALIGASYVDGGLHKAQACIAMFVDDVQWRDFDASRNVFFKLAQDNGPRPPDLRSLEELAGYTFEKKSLLVEATTHPSCLFDNSSRSYEHLEMIGDAILDVIIVSKLYSVTPPLPHFMMHLLKTAAVNGDFLAFINLEHRVEQTETVVTPDLQVFDREVTPMSLWNFMRHSSEPIGVEQAATLKRYEALREDILAALQHGDYYPWDLLARVRAKKFYSDIVESLLGAVWVDSNSLEQCESVLEKFGVLKYLDRLIEDRVQVQHPKELLGRWAVSQTVTYDIDVQEAANGDKCFTCRAMIGSRVVAEVSDGVTKEEVKTKAAEAAVRVLSRENNGMRLIGEEIPPYM
ncbi:Dicer-like protein 2 [Conoideocrella luteorostrata]|uniref:Dicer-like protein 2 n=1 Tax=Conoideocrella luteorostrata TaxID=1105319 RepID=A0AAJ0CJ85_9HYPO|nr:Dicer-like protein 2 [Conoideocrella luteorostrata]